MRFLQSRIYYERSCYGKELKDPDEEDIKEYLPEIYAAAADICPSCVL